ncbi:hypothetical protein AGOR_G00058630 [Albula goreensis]|uniref:Uncharacterized protein n=1 Tax=Albula goreensis TaxID=1534307 RepID=A0A8T3DTL8_9TELE|nr:hypothetical protein AGOR_G00058630 [Albula goreensis]
MSRFDESKRTSGNPTHRGTTGRVGQETQHSGRGLWRTETSHWIVCTSVIGGKRPIALLGTEAGMSQVGYAAVGLHPRVWRPGVYRCENDALR